jgi:hypothetical protein
MLSSIPKRYRDYFLPQLVKQVVITKQAASGKVGKSITGINSIATPANRKLSKMGTSKIHKFKPSVSLKQALEWLSEYGEADSSLMFDNNDCFMFERGEFLEFEGDEDEVPAAADDPEDAELVKRRDEALQRRKAEGNNDIEDDDQEDDSEESSDSEKKQQKPVESFQIGSGKKK